MDIRRIRHRVKDTNESGSRPRVFLTAHHDDQGDYLERIIKMMQDQQDCIVYFYEFAEGKTETADDKELSHALDDMQLVVAAVTMKMLKEPCLAMDSVIPYALDHNIPVLPLMMAPDPAGLFGRKFGDLQYLMPDDPDKTAESFEKKLELYLSDVLVSPETAQRVRDAFDACIFLSYRKKDRTFARELMKMIHRNPRYRDISFWYDEFLVPGEDFNDGISKALEDSDLFTMVVTPNLLEDPNYVMTHEYPAARDKGKTIFPVEMDSTDRSEMKKAYKGIPHCVAASGDARWDRELEKKLKKFCVRTGRDDPQHTFLIGLAYLDGINMEVDTEKAVKLITEAGNAGLEEAMRKLSRMYYYGKGVRKSIAASAEWQEKLKNSLWKRYNKEQTDELLEELYKEQNELANRYYRLRDDIRTANSVQELKTYAEYKVRRGLPGARHDLAFSTCKSGTLFYKLDLFYEAKKELEEAVGLYEEILEEEPETDQLRRELSGGYKFLGFLFSSRTMTEEALDCFHKALQQLLNIRDEASRDSVSNMITSIYQTMGDTLLAEGRTDEAAEMYAKASESAERIPLEKATLKEKAALSHLYSSLENLNDKLGRKEEADAYRRKEIDVIRMRIEDTKEAGGRYAGLYNSMGLLYSFLKEDDEAEKCYIRCLETPEEDPDRPDVYEDHTDAYRRLGQIEKWRGNTDKAEKYFREELKIIRYLADKTGTPEFIDKVADWLEEHGGDDPDVLEEALQFRQKAYSTLKIADYRNRLAGLRNVLEWKYQKNPELKRYRVGLYSHSPDVIKSLSDSLQEAGFKAYESGVFLHDLADLVSDIDPDLLIIDAEDLKFADPRSAKKWIDDQLWRCPDNITILLIAGRQQKEKLDQGAAEGVYELIIRPFTPEELINKVSRILGVKK